jgi:peptide/nickel transport system substrate-binding protein
MSGVVDIRADDKHTVIFSLSSGSADFPYIVSDWRNTIVPAGTKDFDKGIGTGGYMLKSFEPGVRSFAVRNPNYWKEGRAHFDEVEFVAINDATARVNALITDQVDVINRCEGKTFDRLTSKPGIQGIETYGPSHTTFPMRTDKPPFDNNDIRLALKHAFDRKVLLKNILNNHGYLGNDHPIGRSDKYFASELPQREYDPDKAKYYLKKAGQNKLSVKLHVSLASFAGCVDAAVLYKEHAAKAGIDIEVVRSPADGYWSNVWMKEGWTASYWFGRPTADWMFSLVYAETSSQNETFWKHDRFNKLLLEARAELDESKRRELYVEMQKIVRDEGGVVIPFFLAELMAANDKLGFGKVGANIQMDGGRLPERWWFA